MCFVVFVVSGFCSGLPAYAQGSRFHERDLSVALQRTGEPWVGFSLREKNWLLFRETRVWLSTVSRVGDPFVEVTASTDSGGPRLYETTAKLPGLTGGYVRDYRLGALSVLAVNVHTSDISAATTLFHEAFHDFQRAHFAKGALAPVSPDETKIDINYAVDVEVERRILRTALLAKEPAITDSLVNMFFSVRDHRWATTAPALIQRERHWERDEGSAEYVGVRGVSLIPVFGSASTPAVEVARSLAAPLKSFGGSVENRLVRWRSYSTGAALALLLDRRGVDWQERVQKGEWLDAVARDVYKPTIDAGLTALANARFGGVGLRANANPPWGSLAPSPSLADFDRLTGFHLIIEVNLPARVSHSFRTTGNALDGQWEPEPGVTLLMRPTRVLVQDSARSLLDIEVREHPTTWRWFGVDSNRVRISMVLPRAPSILTDPSLRSSTGRPDLTFADRNVRVAIKTHVTVKVWPDSTVLRVGSPAPF